MEGKYSEDQGTKFDKTIKEEKSTGDRLHHRSIWRPDQNGTS